MRRVENAVAPALRLVRALRRTHRKNSRAAPIEKNTGTCDNGWRVRACSSDTGADGRG
jgi:hypothetical protein